MRRAGFAAAAAAGAFALSAPAAQAANFEVNVLTDGAPNACDASCTLRDAVTLANGTGEDDEITFLSGLSGTIRLDAAQGQISTNDTFDLTINGPGAGAISVSGDTNDSNTPDAGDSRILYVDELLGSGLITIEGITFTEGFATADQGGAILTDPGVSEGPDLAIVNAAVTDSTTTDVDGGGGVFATGDLTITNSTISGNDATTGPGGGVSAGKYLEVSGSTISGNTAPTQAGGGIDTGKYGIEMSNSVVTGNAANRGGGLSISSSGPAYGSEVSGSTISGNSAATHGAGIRVGSLDSGDRVTISHSTISGNAGGPASQGGGIGFDESVAGRFQAIDSTISGNTASTGGGVSLGDGTFPLVVGGGSIEFENSTIAANSAAVTGGGFHLNKDSAAPPYYSSTIELDSTIVADNFAAGSAQDLDRFNGSTSGGFELSFSLVEAPGDAPLFPIPSGSAIVGSDPQLGALASNGGPTLTHLPSPTSPAIDKGLAPVRLATDQRGVARTIDLPEPNAVRGDGTDIGSVELTSGAPAASTPPATKKCVKKKKKKGKGKGKGKGKSAAESAKKNKKNKKSKKCPKKKKKRKK